MVSELSADLHEFIDSHVTSFVRWELVVVFARQPGLADESERLAARMGRRPEDVEQALAGLVEEGVVTKVYHDSGRPIYTIADGHLDKARRFAEALNVREQRLSILTRVLRKGGGVR